MFNGPRYDSFRDADFNYVCLIFFITEKKEQIWGKPSTH
jgi:hypothetical protein